MVQTMRDEAPMHRLWYDLRSQSLFEPAFAQMYKAIDASLEDMVWRVVTRYAELVDAGIRVSSALCLRAV